MTAEIAEHLSGSLSRVVGVAEAGRIGVAVSGGGDSMALLSFLHSWCMTRRIELCAVSVDHGIRKESLDECRRVGEFASELDVSHQILTSDGARLTGNLQDAARRLRYTLISDWARTTGLGFVALAHTRDDQAETFLLNLARGSGIDGLAAMPVVVHKFGVCWLRPFLQVGRSELRDYLRGQGIRWVDDPSNEDERFDRVKARRLLEELGPLGVSGARLAATAERMQEARAVLEHVASIAESDLATLDELGETRFGREFWNLQKETRLRLAAAAIGRVAGSVYRPRIVSLCAGLDSVRSGKAFTLSGCLLVPGHDSGFGVVRELASCGPPVPGNRVWDGRWRLCSKRPPPGSVIGPLGNGGLQECKDWRTTERVRESLIASPALRLEGGLLSAPFAGNANGWKFRRVANKVVEAPLLPPV